eukprot:2899303-Pyramimonas_sp.AAC.1
MERATSHRSRFRSVTLLGLGGLFVIMAQLSLHSTQFYRRINCGAASTEPQEPLPSGEVRESSPQLRNSPPSAQAQYDSVK